MTFPENIFFRKRHGLLFVYLVCLSVNKFTREDIFMRKKLQTLIILSFIIFHSLSVPTIFSTDVHAISPYGFDSEWVS